MDEKIAEAILIEKAKRLLVLRPRSEKEIKTYFSRQKKFSSLPDRFFSRLIEVLKQSRLIDDEAFVYWWIDQRDYFNPRGVFVLKKELLAKGISADLINGIVTNNRFFEGEIKRAKAVLEKKFLRSSIDKLAVIREKALSLLTRRGFSFSVSKKAFEEFVNKE